MMDNTAKYSLISTSSHLFQDISVISPYRPLNAWRKIFFKYAAGNCHITFIDNRLPQILFNDAIVECNTTLIVFDASTTIPFIKWIRNVCRNVRIILWYWNPVKEITYLPPQKVGDVEKWSYSEKDCKKYSMKFNTTFYSKKYKLPIQKIERDLFFIGIDKGRYQKIHRYRKQLENSGLSTYIHISPDHRYQKFNKRGYLSPIPYKKVLEEIAKSRALLDIYNDPNAGFSLRVMESLFFRKKLVTNNYGVFNADFYRPENIFVLGVDDISNIYSFIHSPYKEVPEEVVMYYDFDNWLNRFNGT